MSRTDRATSDPFPAETPGAGGSHIAPGTGVHAAHIDFIASDARVEFSNQRNAMSYGNNCCIRPFLWALRAASLSASAARRASSEPRQSAIRCCSASRDAAAVSSSTRQARSRGTCCLSLGRTHGGLWTNNSPPLVVGSAGWGDAEREARIFAGCCADVKANRRPRHPPQMNEHLTPSLSPEYRGEGVRVAAPQKCRVLGGGGRVRGSSRTPIHVVRLRPPRGRGHPPNFAARRAISSSDTSSTCVPIDHSCPNGSVSFP